jgi:hypothetical protein
MSRRSPKHRPSSVKATTVIETTCRCGLPVSIGTANGQPAAFHAQPQCKDFVERELSPYLRWLAEGVKETKDVDKIVQFTKILDKFTKEHLGAGDRSRGGNGIGAKVHSSTSEGMIAGLFASRTMACEVCGEDAEYAEGWRKDNCTCMEPEGTHIVRRCAAGHENVSHIAGGEIEGSWENQAGSDEAILRTRMDRKTTSMLDKVADECGITRDELITRTLDRAVGQEKCLRCQHRSKRHGSKGEYPCEIPDCGCKAYVGSVKEVIAAKKEADASKSWLSKVILGPKTRKVMAKIMRAVGPSVPTEDVSSAILTRVTLNLHCGTCHHPVMLHKVEESAPGPCGEEGCGCQECVFDGVQADNAMASLDVEEVSKSLRDRAEMEKTIEARPWVAIALKELDSEPAGCRDLFVRAMSALQEHSSSKIRVPLLGEMPFADVKRELGQRSIFESALFWQPSGFARSAGLFRELLRLEQIAHRDFDKVIVSKGLGSLLLGSEADLDRAVAATPGSRRRHRHHYLSTQLLSTMRLIWADKREFRLSPGIAESLLLTEVKGINISELKLPYESFLIRFPAGLIDLAAEDGSVYPMVSAIVSEWDVSEGFWKDGAKARGVSPKKRAITIYGMGTWNKQSADAGDTTSLGWLACLDDNEVATLGLWSVEGGSADALPNERAFTVNQQAVKLATRLVLNTCLYVSLPNSDVVLDGQETLNRLRERVRKHPKGSHKGERAREELRGEEKKPQVRKVGWSIRVPASVREAASHERTARGRHFTAQWLVRGHWRNQAIGDRVEGKHKLKWIQPYYCRRDLGERLKLAPYRVS